MALSDSISDLITAYKSHPSGERRNRLISHLKDAEAHAKLLEQEDPRIKSAAEEASLDAFAPVGQLPGCTCIFTAGVRTARSKTCPVHTS